MSDFWIEDPKDGDFVSLIEKLEAQSLAQLEADSRKAVLEHKAHSDKSAMISEGSDAMAASFPHKKNKKKQVKALGAPSVYIKNSAPFNTAKPSFKTAADVSESKFAKRAHSGILLYLLMMLAFGMVFILSGDPQFRIFCVAAFFIVSIAFFSSGKKSKRGS